MGRAAGRHLRSVPAPLPQVWRRERLVSLDPQVHQSRAAEYSESVRARRLSDTRSNRPIAKIRVTRRVPAEIRNGEWECQAFTPDGNVNDKANLPACYECHKPFEKEDFLTNRAKLAGSFPSGAQVTVGT